MCRQAFCLNGLSIGDDAGKACNGGVCPCKLSYQFDSLFAKAAATCTAGCFGGLSHHGGLGVVLLHRHVSVFGVLSFTLCFCAMSHYVERRYGMVPCITCGIEITQEYAVLLRRRCQK